MVQSKSVHPLREPSWLMGTYLHGDIDRRTHSLHSLLCTSSFDGRLPAASCASTSPLRPQVAGLLAASAVALSHVLLGGWLPVQPGCVMQSSRPRRVGSSRKLSSTTCRTCVTHLHTCDMCQMCDMAKNMSSSYVCRTCASLHGPSACVGCVCVCVCLQSRQILTCHTPKVCVCCKLASPLAAASSATLKHAVPLLLSGVQCIHACPDRHTLGFTGPRLHMTN